MNKKLLIILLAGLVLVAGFTFVYAKHINKEATSSKIIPRGQDKLAETPTVAKREIPSSYYSDVIPRSYSGISPEDLQVKLADVEGTIKYANQYGTQEEAPLTECLIDPNLQPCCYYQPWPDYFDDRLNCCGSYVEYWVRQDPQLNPDLSACGYPIYPFEVSGIYLRMNTPGPCSLLIRVGAYGYWMSDPAGTWVYLDEAGMFYVGLEIPEEERPCVHGQFFAYWKLMNSDEFTEGPDPERCGPDTTRYGFWVTTYFDQAPIIPGIHDGYYRSEIVGPAPPYIYYITDVYGGCVVLRAEGFTRDQNECDLVDVWYHKAAQGEWECREPVREDLELCIVDISEDDPPETTWGSVYLVEPVNYGYAPDGMPDFHQAEPNWCGPAALSNCLWWCFAGGFPWYAISNWYGGWDPTIPPAMIAELAACMNTGPQGTDVYDLQQCILDLVDSHGFWITENTIVQPTYEDIEYQVRRSQDVILLLGFWYLDEVEEIWYRLGGHYVTMDGVNIEQFMFSFSDPWLNGFCDGLTPGDSSGGVFYVHDHTQNTDPPLHYDAGNVSHDYYLIGWPSSSPGGFLFIPDYDVYEEAFYGMNFTTELEPYMAPSPTTQYPVVTEIEYAVVICPAEPFVSDQLDSWNVAMIKSNYGEEGPGFVFWEYYPDYTDDLFEGTILLGTSADDLAMGVTAVGEDIGFFPYGDLVCDYEVYDDVLLEVCRTSFHHNVPGHELPLDVEMLGIGFDPGGDVYYLEPEGDVVIQKFVITNTGETQIDDLEWALFMDWDVNLPEVNTSFGGGDSVTNTYWAYDSTEEGKVAYVTLAPTSLGKIAPGMDIGDHNSYFYEFVPGGPYDSLKFMMEMTYWSVPDKTPAHTDTFDFGYLLNSEKFSLAPGEKALEEYLIWYDTQIPSTDYTGYRCKLYRLLRLAGFYRGDVGDFNTGVASPGLLDIADIVYLVGYTLRSGPPPLPFINQGDVNCDGEVKIDDVVFLVNYILKSKPDAPIDKNRFFDEEYEQLFKRTSLFTDPQWQNLGVGCYPYRP